MSTSGTVTVVVGVDGSDHAERALAWAIEEAKLRGARLHAVTAWHASMDYGSPGYAPTAATTIEGSLRDVAHGIATAAAEQARAAGVEAEATVHQGQAVVALIDAAADAELLVVGSRGHGGFAGLLLGSVGAQSAQHAACPVVIVR